MADESYIPRPQISAHLQHLQHAAVHALQPTEVENAVVAGHQVQELLCMLMDAVLRVGASATGAAGTQISKSVDKSAFPAHSSRHVPGHEADTP